MNKLLMHTAAKPAAFALCLLPFAWLFYGAATDRLGANAAEVIIRSTGDWALRGLCIALAVTPLRVIAGLPALARYRRMLGLFTFFYALLHLVAYAWLDQGLDVPGILRDTAQRPFILVGMLAFLILLVLAATSFHRAIRWLGGRRWQALHRTVYAVAGLALLHFFWMRAGKNLFGEVAVYAAILAALLGWRMWKALRGARACRAAAS
ncbi:sulfoxide reductase heme-binding subunit YedZ [Paracidovorax avenae]|uniref:sulfite oxidase heme-binding subunit YedZ n=1 Tax=Paracidovorax avenae TaxID=80867 RepID=UPI000D15F584|nr:protein-methionine-sulfoxide reductase heme-binding subunit MsrQ [Paracidovorax avenae]AVT15501.1 sulfoxide reductase heme-binding subunit YedZ [Paracidovorax avenae]